MFYIFRIIYLYYLLLYRSQFFRSFDSRGMNKQITISFIETSDHEIDIEIDSSDPQDDINDIIGLLHSTMISLAQGLPEEDLKG